MNIQTETISTQRLILRQFRLADCESIHKNWASDEKLQNDYGEPVYATLEETIPLIEKYIDGYSEGKSIRWGAFLKGDNPNNCIGAKYQRHGYCTEALKSVIDYGFNYDGVLRDYFLIDGKYYDRLYYSILENER